MTAFKASLRSIEVVHGPCLFIISALKYSDQTFWVKSVKLHAPKPGLDLSNLKYEDYTDEEIDWKSVPDSVKTKFERDLFPEL